MRARPWRSGPSVGRRSRSRPPLRIGVARLWRLRLGLSGLRPGVELRLERGELVLGGPFLRRPTLAVRPRRPAAIRSPTSRACRTTRASGDRGSVQRGPNVAHRGRESRQAPDLRPGPSRTTRTATGTSHRRAHQPRRRPPASGLVPPVQRSGRAGRRRINRTAPRQPQPPQDQPRPPRAPAGPAPARQAGRRGVDRTRPAARRRPPRRAVAAVPGRPRPGRFGAGPPSCRPPPPLPQAHSRRPHQHPRRPPQLRAHPRRRAGTARPAPPRGRTRRAGPADATAPAPARPPLGGRTGALAPPAVRARRRRAASMPSPSRRPSRAATVAARRHPAVVLRRAVAPRPAPPVAASTAFAARRSAGRTGTACRPRPRRSPRRRAKGSCPDWPPRARPRRRPQRSRPDRRGSSRSREAGVSRKRRARCETTGPARGSPERGRRSPPSPESASVGPRRVAGRRGPSARLAADQARDRGVARAALEAHDEGA